MKNIVVVGAGLGGLLIAGLLAKRGNRVVVMERSPILGGRSHVISSNGFTMSYGAHAVLAPKQEPMNSVIRELGLPMVYKKASLTKFKLFMEGKVISSPLGSGALTSPAVRGFFKHILCLKQFYQMMKQQPQFSENVSVKQWIEENIKNPDVAKILNAYAALSVYDGALDLYSMNHFVELTAREYAKNEPLSYMRYDVLLDELQKIILNNGGSIIFEKQITDLIIEAGTIKGVVCSGEKQYFHNVVLNLPPKDLGKIFTSTSLSDEFESYLNQRAQYVYVYDLMLSKRIRSDITNLLDLDEGLYLNDYSLYNPSSAPAEGQLINGLKFLNEQEQSDDSHAPHSQKAFENLLHKVYPGWENFVVSKRIINRAMVNGIARRVGAKLLPLQSQSVQGLYLVGDSTEGRGSLGMPCYDSAKKVADMLS